MATSQQVTCIIPDASDADRRIDAIGGAGWKLSLDDAIAEIESKRKAFYTMVGGKRADVIIAKRNGKKYLKTTADGEEPNNLLSLPRCP